MGGRDWRRLLILACAALAPPPGCASQNRGENLVSRGGKHAGGVPREKIESPLVRSAGNRSIQTAAAPTAVGDERATPRDILQPGRLGRGNQLSAPIAQVSFKPPGRPPAVIGPTASSRRAGELPGAAKFASPTAAQLQTPSEEAIPPGERKMPIDLPTALRLANAQNLQVALAREQIRQALARVEAARALWLPSIRGGLNYNRHEGSIQQVDGRQFNTSRGAFYSGLGAGVYGAGTPMVPGIYASFHLTDALFEPLAARQFAAARSRAATAATNDALLEVSLAYIEMLRAHQELAIALGIRADVEQLAGLTGHYARTGQGLQADADRLRAELMVRKNEVVRGEEACQVASARLAQLLHVDPTVFLQPIEPALVEINLAPPDIPLAELVAQGLSARPELAENRLLVAEAVTRLRRERLAPLLPSVLLGTSYGAMSSGINSNFAPGTGRLDADAVAYWELRNLGFGEQAARNDAGSVVRQAQVRRLAVMDQVAREVTEAAVQSEARRRQIEIARHGIQAAVDSHRRNLARIEAAKGLPIEALQSVQALAFAQREYLRALADYDAAQFTLYRALGWPSRLDVPAAINPPPK